MELIPIVNHIQIARFTIGMIDGLESISTYLVDCHEVE